MLGRLSYTFLQPDGVTPYANKMVLVSENRTDPPVSAQVFNATGIPQLSSIAYTDGGGSVTVSVDLSRRYQLILKNDNGSEIERVMDATPSPGGVIDSSAQNGNQRRRGTAAQLAAANPVLLVGEEGLETDTGKTKMGDGTTAWSALKYRWPFDPSSVVITPTIADLGDSISWYNTDTATAGQDSYNSRGFLTQAVYLLRGRVDFPLSNNFGVSGETTAQMLARVAAVTTAKPGICTVMGGANDFNVPANLASAAASAAAFASITANLSAIYTALINASIVVVAMCCAARGSWSALSASEIIIARKLQTRVNRWIINQAAQHPDGRFYVARSDISIADYGTSTVNPLAGTTGDNLHPTGLGAFYLARYPKGGSLYDILDKILPPLTQEHFRTDIYDAIDNPGGSLLTNPMPLGTAGSAGTGVTGSVATGMTISRTLGSTLTAVASKVAATDNDGATIPQGGEFQRIVLGASGVGASSETLRVRLSVNAGASTYAAGDVLQAGIEIKQAGMANVLTQVLAVNDFDGATNFLHYGNSGSGVGSDREPADCTRLIVSPEFTVRAYAGSGTQAINFDLLISCICSGSAPTGTIDIRHLYLRKRQLG